MSTLLIEMPSGVAGDMMLAALLDLGGDLERLQSDLLALGVGSIRIAAKRIITSGISGMQVDVEADQEAQWEQRLAHGTRAHKQQHGHLHSHEHPHDHDHGHGHGHGDHTHAHPGAALASDAPRLILRGASAKKKKAHAHRPYHVIRELLGRAALPARVKERAQRVFRILAEAEGQVHGVAADDVEFHEVGAIDAIADVVGCCLLMEQLDVSRVIAGPLLPGSGFVLCDHGRMPVPVPAVAAMLAQTRAPHRQLARETGELTTPTGCALVTALADEFLGSDAGAIMTSRKVGYGVGHRIIPELVNVLRLSLLDDAPNQDTVAELRCQIDDATGESLAALLDELMSVGARDAYLSPVLMKKGRPGHELTVLCSPGERERIAALLMAHSTTIGVRHQLLQRQLLPRRAEAVAVRGHTIALKVVTLPDGSERSKPEADSVLAAARALGLGFDAVQRAALAAWENRPPR